MFNKYVLVGGFLMTINTVSMIERTGPITHGVTVKVMHILLTVFFPVLVRSSLSYFGFVGHDV